VRIDSGPEPPSLDRRALRLGCGVPFVDDTIVAAMRYTGNVSARVAPRKVAESGVRLAPEPWAPRLEDLPIHFECEVVDELPLGTHAMVLGEVRRVRLHPDLSPANPLVWCPWAEPRPVVA
jgi:flavin reductase (DIM6/NTAB) family NADH-FMN oxidoreductase RutF